MKVGSVALDDCLTNMRRFGVIYVVIESMKKIQEGIMMFIVNFLTTNQEKERVRKLFKQIDANGDGMISREEMRRAFEKS
jgi:Ca2+-binding EF-hand superfamily protein